MWITYSKLIVRVFTSAQLAIIVLPFSVEWSGLLRSVRLWMLPRQCSAAVERGTGSSSHGALVLRHGARFRLQLLSSGRG